MKPVLARFPLLGLFLFNLSIGGCVTLEKSREKASDFSSQWHRSAERTWLGPDYWANRLQDWQLKDGRAEVTEHGSGLPYRTVHLLSRQLSADRGNFALHVTVGPAGDPGTFNQRSAAGFLVGAGRGMNRKSAAIIHGQLGKGAGLFAGVDREGFLFIADLEDVQDDKTPLVLVSSKQSVGPPTGVNLALVATALGKGQHKLALSAVHTTGDEIEILETTVESDRLVGNVGLISHSGRIGRGGPGNAKGGRYWFSDFRAGGDKLAVVEDGTLGPVISAQHTLSDGVLKMTAQFAPIGEGDSKTATLEAREGAMWKTVATAPIREDCYTANFRVENWRDMRDIRYRVVYDLKYADGMVDRFRWNGTIRKDPIDKSEIVLAAFTGNHNNSKGLNQSPFDWTTGVWFPHDDLVSHVRMHEPDVLFFSGDQVYEGASPTRPDRKEIMLDYLYKWYLWCWAYGDLARDIPCITIPDDHDVYQGNIWGEGGRKATRDHNGGYVHPAPFVRMVERTQTDNLPDPFDPAPIGQGIGVYFTNMTYGRVGFAILEDRKFKSGCAGRIEGQTRGRPDHINDPDFDIRKADVPGLKLLGDRQLEFLDNWAADWAGQDMKAALSQTIFANMATHHGAGLFRLIADLDSNGWPQTGRRKAIDALRRGFAVHVAGDQHLASLVHHGIDEQNDAIWSFCVPSVANFYPRAWMPPQPGKNRERGMTEYMGENRDGFGNLVNVFATTNPWHPEVDTGVAKTGREPSELHDKMPGYGIVRFNKPNREITFECWPRYAVPGKDEQYRGWPRTVSMFDNYDRKAVHWLPTLKVNGVPNPVVQVTDESTGEVLYTVRAKGNTFKPRVFKPGRYTIRIGEPADNRVRELIGVQSKESDLESVELTIP